MDALERKVHEHAAKAREEEPKLYVERAKHVWRLVTGLEPSYAEVVTIQHKGGFPHVIVEVDGVRLSAGLKYTKTRGDFHQWDIAGGVFGRKATGNDDFNLINLESYLDKRRKRLKKRGLYEPQR